MTDIQQIRNHIIDMIEEIGWTRATIIPGHTLDRIGMDSLDMIELDGMIEESYPTAYHGRTDTPVDMDHTIDQIAHTIHARISRTSAH